MRACVARTLESLWFQTARIVIVFHAFSFTFAISLLCLAVTHTLLATIVTHVTHAHSSIPTNFVRLVCASAIKSLERRSASGWRLPKSLHRCPSAEVTAHFFCLSDGFKSRASWTHAPRQLGAKSNWQSSRVLNSTEQEHSTSTGLTEVISSSPRRKYARLTPDDPCAST